MNSLALGVVEYTQVQGQDVKIFGRQRNIAPKETIHPDHVDRPGALTAVSTGEADRHRRKPAEAALVVLL